VDIDPTKLQEIYSTLTQCQSLLARNEYQITDLEKRIRELEQGGVRFEGKLEQVAESRKDSTQRFDKYQGLSGNVQTLMEWKMASDARMDKLATSLWSAVVTGIVGFVGMTVVFYLNSTTKPVKAMDVPAENQKPKPVVSATIEPDIEQSEPKC
jgi:predicted RNase H-like nuclease (RuvC/YqgF family)